MSYTVIRPKDHDGWLAERAKGIGSSDAGTIMGVSPFSTPLKLWRLKKGLEPPVPETAAMRDGHCYELAVTEYFRQVAKVDIDYSSEGDWLAVDDEKPYLRVSPDRLFWPEGAEHLPENRLILEIKSTSKLVDPDNLPLYWFCQVQYQMGVMGVKMAAIAWVTSEPRLNMNHTWVPFNPAFFKTLVEQIDRFWNVNILQDVEPEGITEEDMATKWPQSDPTKTAWAQSEDYLNCQQFVQLTKEIADKNDQLSKLAASIKGSIKDAEILMFEDPETGEKTLLAKNKSINETVFDEARLEQEDPETYTRYMRKFFDKNTFKDEEPDIFKKYTETRKGYRRFSVCIK